MASEGRSLPCQASLMYRSSCSVLLKCQNAVLNVGTVQKYQLAHYPPHLSFTLKHFRNKEIRNLETSHCVEIALSKAFKENNCKEIKLPSLSLPWKDLNILVVSAANCIGI